MDLRNILEAKPAEFADELDVKREGKGQFQDESKILGVSNWEDHGVIN